MPLFGPAGRGGAMRRGRRRGLAVGAAVGSAAARRNQPSQGAQEAPAQQDTDDSMQQMLELEKLGQLKANGVLTQEEFDAKKKEVLGL